jgi:hypothetical protein
MKCRELLVSLQYFGRGIDSFPEFNLILRIFEKEGNVSLEYDDFELAQHERDAFQFWNMMAGSGVMGSRIHEGSRAFYMVFQMSRVNI